MCVCVRGWVWVYTCVTVCVCEVRVCVCVRVNYTFFANINFWALKGFDVYLIYFNVPYSLVICRTYMQTGLMARSNCLLCFACLVKSASYIINYCALWKPFFIFFWFLALSIVFICRFTLRLLVDGCINYCLTWRQNDWMMLAHGNYMHCNKMEWHCHVSFTRVLLMNDTECEIMN